MTVQLTGGLARRHGRKRFSVSSYLLRQPDPVAPLLQARRDGEGKIARHRAPLLVDNELMLHLEMITRCFGVNIRSPSPGSRANCRQSVKHIWLGWSKRREKKKKKRNACTGSQSRLRPEPKCFKWITPVCHGDYTLLAGTTTT